MGRAPKYVPLAAGTSGGNFIPAQQVQRADGYPGQVARAAQQGYPGAMAHQGQQPTGPPQQQVQQPYPPPPQQPPVQQPQAYPYPNGQQRQWQQFPGQMPPQVPPQQHYAPQYAPQYPPPAHYPPPPANNMSGTVPPHHMPQFQAHHAPPAYAQPVPATPPSYRDLQRQRAIDAFIQFDADGSGRLDFTEFSFALGALGVDLGLGSDQAKVIFEMFDTDQDGRVSQAEFLELFIANYAA